MSDEQKHERERDGHQWSEGVSRSTSWGRSETTTDGKSVSRSVTVTRSETHGESRS